MKKKSTHIAKIFTLLVEDPGDYYHKPEGVVFIDNLGNHTLYSADSRFNFLKSILHKFPEAELEAGLSFREHQVRLQDITADFAADFELVVEEMLAILHTIYSHNERQYFFLDKFFKPNAQNSYFVP